MKLIQILAASTLGLSAPAFAQATDHATHHAPAASAATPDVDGEVRKIDKEQGKLTLKHGPIPNLDMPGMTMVFKVADAALLEPLRVGDKVKFAAENRNGALTVTAIKPAP